MCEGKMCKFQTRFFAVAAVSRCWVSGWCVKSELWLFCPQKSSVSRWVWITQAFTSCKRRKVFFLLSSVFKVFSWARLFPLQVFKVFTTYAEGTSLKVVMVAGQRSFAAEQASLSELRSVQFSWLKITNSVKDMRVPKCNVGLLPHSNNC